MSYIEDIGVMSYFDDNEDFLIRRGIPMGKKRSNDRPMFTRGYKDSRERLAKNPHFSRSCSNCDFYFQAVGDKTECCQNPNVLKFDMVFSENNVYCVHWNQSKRVKSDTTLFKTKTGRSRLD